MDNLGLRKRFNAYNKYYFDGRLSPSIRVVFGKTTSNSDGNWNPKKNEIVLHRSLKSHDALASICLLHEMAHAKLASSYLGGISVEDPHHGMVYQAEIYRLIQAGAYDGLL